MLKILRFTIDFKNFIVRGDVTLFRISYLNFENKIRLLVQGEDSVTLGFKSYITDSMIESDESVNVLIGNYCSIAHGVFFCIGRNHIMKNVTTYPEYLIGREEANFETKKNSSIYNHYQVSIGHDVWIGRGVTIMGGVKIGNGAVIGANAVVAKDIPPYAVAVGNPARVIKYRFDKIVIQKLQAIKWWYWEESKIVANKELIHNMDEFVNKFYEDSLLQPIKNATVEYLQESRAKGIKILYFIPDFDWEYCVWQKVITSYLEKYSINDQVMLIIEVKPDHHRQYQAEINQIRQWIARKGEQAPLVIENHGVDMVPLDILQSADVFITTRAYESIKAIDYGMGYGIEIISGLDAEIFQ